MKYFKNYSLIALLVLGTSLSGCASFTGAESKENIAQLKYGMSKAQVLNLLGTPDSVVPEKTSDRWVYEYRSEGKKGHNLFIEFKNNELSKTGELNGREVAAAEETRTPGTCTKWVRPEFVEQSLCTH